MNHEFGRLLNYNIEKRDDMLQNTTTGMLGSKLITHDIYNKNYQKYGLNFLIVDY